MRKLILLLFSASISLLSFGQQTDSANTTQFNIIRDETTPGGNTKLRMRDAYEVLNSSKVNRAEQITASGTDTYAVSGNSTLSYSNPFQVLVKFTNANTGAATLNVNSLGAKAIKKNGSSALVSGDIKAGQVFLLSYDGTNFQMIGDGGGGLTYDLPLTLNANTLQVVTSSPGQVLVGNGSSLATAVTMSGDGTMSSAGSLSVAKILGNSVPANSSGVLTNNGSGTLTWGSAGISSVSGTSSRISSTGGSTPVLDIDAAYIGQTSITTLGTVATGTWSATAVGPTKGGTGQTTVTTGDLLYGSGSNTWGKLAVGSNGKVLTVSSGLPSWQDAAAGGVSSVSGTSNRISSTGGATPVLDIDAAYVGQASITTLGTVATGTWSGTAIGPTKGGTGFTTVTTGDLIYGSGSNTWGKLALGTTLQQIRVNSGATNIEYYTPTDNPMTTIGDIIQGTTSGAPARLAAVIQGNALISGGVGTANSWGKIGLTTHISGTLASANGGTDNSTYAVGDILYASATTPTLSKLADVAAGAYLRSGGVNTAPLWSTLILPNAATSGRIAFASATNTYGEASTFTYTTAAGLTVTNGITLNYVAKTATYPVVATDYLIEATSGTFTTTLPTAVGITGKVYEFTNSGAGVITIATTSSQTFVNVTATPTTLTLAQFQSARVMSNGANWLKISGL